MSDVEEKAAKMGFIDKEAWVSQGKDPEKWRPAEEFVERGENIVPIMRDRIDRLEKELEVISKLNKTELDRVKKDSYDRATREYDEKLKNLNKQKFDAIQDGNVEEFQRVEGQISNLKRPEEPVNEPIHNPVFEDWSKKNDWYAPDIGNIGNADRELTIFANGVGATIAGQKLPAEQFYAEVERQVKAAFPHKFENKHRAEAGIAEGGRPNMGKTKKTWSDLPPEAKKAYERSAERLKKHGREYKKEDYVKDYFEED